YYNVVKGVLLFDPATKKYKQIDISPLDNASKVFHIVKENTFVSMEITYDWNNDTKQNIYTKSVLKNNVLIPLTRKVVTFIGLYSDSEIKKYYRQEERFENGKWV